MKTPITLLILATLACCQAPPAPSTQSIDHSKSLATEDLEAREDAVETARGLKPDAVLALVPMLGDQDPDVAKAALLSLQNVVHHAARPGAAKDRMECASLLLYSMDQKPTLKKEAREEIARLIAYVGDDEETVEALADLLSSSDIADTLCWTLESLAHPASASALKEQVEDRKGKSRIQAARALSALSPQPDSEFWIDVLADAPEPLAQIAFRSLAKDPNASTQTFLLTSLETRKPGSVDACMDYAEGLIKQGQRERASEIYLKLMAQDQAHIRAAATRGLGLASGISNTPHLLSALGDEDRSVQAQAELYLADLKDPDLDRQLRESLSHQSMPRRAARLRVLWKRSEQVATQVAQTCVTDPNGELRIEAMKLLSASDVPGLEDLFWKAALQSEGEERQVAFLGYLAQAKNIAEEGEKDKALSMVHASLENGLVGKPLEQALLNIRTFGGIESLKVLDSLPDDPSARGEICRTRLALANEIVLENPDEAIRQFEWIYQNGTSRRQRQDATERLEELGIDTETYPRRVGFLIAWHTLGPFSAATEENLATHPFGQDIDIDASFDYPGETEEGTDEPESLSWAYVTTNDLDGTFNLKDTYEKDNDVCAYAFTTLDRPEEANGVLKLGSDDGVACWINGELVHSNNAARGVHVDEDVVSIQWRTGTNEILLKITQGSGDWGFCARVCDADGNPIDLLQE